MAETAVLLLVVFALVPLAHSASAVLKVTVGDTVVLKCPSNDDNHRFQFWQLMTTNQMISPTNKYDRDKYKYEVLTGRLTIRGVSSNEFGLYTCVCKHIDNDSFHSESVELIINNNSEQVYQADPFANEYRVALLLIVTLVLIVLLLILYYISTDRSPRFSVLADEEAPNEAGPSNIAPRNRLSDLDSHGVDTALPQPEAFTDVRLNDSRI